MELWQQQHALATHFKAGIKNLLAQQQLLQAHKLLTTTTIHCMQNGQQILIQ